MDFEIVGKIADVEIIAVNLSIRELDSLKENHGGKRWRKMKGTAFVRLHSGNIRKAELHWYEAHAIGKKKMKIKRFLD